MNVNIVREKNVAVRYILAIILLLIVVILYFTLAESKFIFVLLVLINLISLTFNNDGLKYKNIGSLEIDANKITIAITGSEIKEFNVNQLISMSIYHYYFYPKHILYKTNNELKVVIERGEEEISFKILIKGKKNKIKFKELLEQLYKTGIKIKEYDANGMRSFLFKSNMNYKEIQEVKQKYNLSWF